jgi:putative transposase
VNQWLRNIQVGCGLWSAGILESSKKFFSQTRSQRCWIHKTANILNKLPKHSLAKAKQYIHDIWMAKTRKYAEKAFDLFITTYEFKYPKAARACVSRTTILTMVYKLDLSAEKGWQKLRGFRRLADVINGIKFIDGVDEEIFERQRNAA